MKLTGSQIISASRQTVWKGLNDPKVLQQCIPGCSKIEASSPTEMKATVTMAVGPVKANFSGQVTLSDLQPPESYRISGKGDGGFAGFASGGATVRLSELSANETQMDYDVDAQIGGKMAMLGSRLIDSTATSLAKQFFTKFGSLMKSAHVERAPSPTPKASTGSRRGKTTKKATVKSATKAGKKPVKTTAKKAAKPPVKKPSGKKAKKPK